MSRAVLRAMGCEVVVVGAQPDELAAIELLFAEREARFSRFVGGSELGHVNAATTETVVVSTAFAETLRQALAAAALTGGLVDPTVGEALVAAGYDRDFDRLEDDPRPPGTSSVRRADAVLVSGRLVTRPVGLVLDLNGVVKSMAVDDAAALLSGPGLVSAGGDLAVRGDQIVALPGGGAVHVHAGGLATSGRTRRSWHRGGALQHHLIDPRTGRPSTARWADVTVSGASCLVADVAAKAAFLLDGDGPSWLDALSLPGRFRLPTGDVVENAAWSSALGARGAPSGAVA